MTSANISDVMVPNPYATVDNSKANGKSDVNFSSMMAKTMNSVDVKASAEISEPAQKLNSNSDKTSNSKTSKASDDSYSFNSSKARDNIKEVKEENLSDEEIEEVKDEVEKALNEITEVLMDKLDVTEEDIEDAMEALGLTFLDLTNPAELVKLVALLNEDADATSLLMDTNFTELVADVNEIFSNLEENVNLDMEKIISLMDEVEEPLNDAFLSKVVTEAETDVFEVKTEALNDDNLYVKAEAVTTEEEPAPIAKEIQATNEPILRNKETEGSEVVTDAEDSSETEADVIKPEMKLDNSKDEQGLTGDSNEGKNFFGQTVKGYEVSSTVVDSASEVTPYTEVNPTEIVNQLMERASITLNKEVTTMQMELNPESLGKLFLEVSSDKEGNVTVKLVAENEAVKNALETQIALVQEKMNAQGMKVNAVEVSVGTHEFEENLEQDAASQNERELSEEQQRNSNGQQRRTRNIDLNNLDEMQGLMTEEEELVAKIMRDNGNTVNLTA